MTFFIHLCWSWFLRKGDQTWNIHLRLLTFLWSVKQFEARPGNVIIAGKYYFNNIWWWLNEDRKSFPTISSYTLRRFNMSIKHLNVIVWTGWVFFQLEFNKFQFDDIFRRNVDYPFTAFRRWVIAGKMWREDVPRRIGEGCAAICWTKLKKEKYVHFLGKQNF